MPDTETLVRHLRDLLIEDLSPILAGRPVILVNQHAARNVIDSYLTDAGAPEVTHLRALEDRATLTEYFRDFDHTLANPHEDLLQSLHAIDPHKRAVVYAGSPVSHPTLDGRPVIGARLPAWKQAESKQSQVAILGQQARYDVTYIPFNDTRDPDEFAELLRSRTPCVAAGDPHDMISMSSDHVYFIHQRLSDEAITDISRRLLHACRGVRVSRFMTGCPTTIYGVLIGDRLSFLGPVEALVGYTESDGRVTAPGVFAPVADATSFSHSDTARLADLVLRLAQETGFQGAFGVDGVVSDGRFTAHEINTRVCGGFSLVSHMLNGTLSFGVVDIVARHGSTHQDDILDLLDQVNEALFPHHPDARIWSDAACEKHLRSVAPRSSDKWSLERWTQEVRRSALRSLSPFFAVEQDAVARS
ncbi:hypothetical protein brsh051_24230 [Brooklawnia propionicigenes]|uniref:ATP-grasp domain-containing protein n=1 Tax=Brooklawnia propionicigenes TaxID=3041175 RepID=A0AAN0KB49_9ACTN|nr:hypothetical protein [Brooklawnia sp. SH051]BEH03142.1 hypothetical protein brsh051_24230 [Brooklawnia sp. SH051]